MSRLSIELSKEQHQKIKALAALEGQSMKSFILDKLFKSNDDETAAMKELEQLLISRIESAKKSKPSNLSVQEITDNVLRANN